MRVSPILGGLSMQLLTVTGIEDRKARMMMKSIKCTRISWEFETQDRICVSRVLERIQHSGKVK